MFHFGFLVSAMTICIYGATINESNGGAQRKLEFVNKNNGSWIFIKRMTLTHILENGNQSAIQTDLEDVVVGDNSVTSYPYELPTESTKDYWFMLVIVNDYMDVLRTKSAVNCNLEDKDMGIVRLYIDLSSKKVTIKPPISPSCEITLYSARNVGELKGNGERDLIHASFNLKYGKFIVENKFGSQIVVEKLTYYIGNNAHDPSNTVVDNLTLEGNAASKPYDFAFANGFLPPRDYWFVQVRIGNDVLKTKSNFYCNITSGDTGTTKLIIDILSKKFHVIPPVSSSCTVSLL